MKGTFLRVYIYKNIINDGNVQLNYNSNKKRHKWNCEWNDF